MCKSIYIASGSVRGWCGHIHRSYETAKQCQTKDIKACNSLPGGNCYSDRKIYKFDSKYRNQVPLWYHKQYESIGYLIDEL